MHLSQPPSTTVAFSQTVSPPQLQESGGPDKQLPKTCHYYTTQKRSALAELKAASNTLKTRAGQNHSDYNGLSACLHGPWKSAPCGTFISCHSLEVRNSRVKIFGPQGRSLPDSNRRTRGHLNVYLAVGINYLYFCWTPLTSLSSAKTSVLRMRTFY